MLVAWYSWRFARISNNNNNNILLNSKAIEKVSKKKKKEKTENIKNPNMYGKILWEKWTFVSYVNINQKDYNLFTFCLFSMSEIEFKAQQKRKKRERVAMIRSFGMFYVNHVLV